MDLRTLILLFVMFLCSLEVAANDKTSIFILHSYSQEYPWTKRQHQGFIEELSSDSQLSYPINVEYLDTKRIQYNAQYAEKFAEYIRFKYKKCNPSIIYITDDNALSFAESHLRKIFPDTPLIFSGINQYAVKDTLDKQFYTGVFEKKEISPNVELMKYISPDIENITVIGDESETFESIKVEIEKEISNTGDINIEYISDKSIENILDRLSVSKNKFIFLTTIGALRDNRGLNLTLESAIGMIARTGDYTIISMEDVYITRDVLGGYATSGTRQGSTAAKMAKKYLSGINIRDIEYITSSPNEYIFNDIELKNVIATIPTEILDNAKILNPIPTFYESNRNVIVGAIYFLAILLVGLLITSLYIVIRKNRIIDKSIDKIKESESRYRELIEHLNAGVIVHASDTSIMLANPKASEILGFSIDTLSEKDAKDSAWRFVDQDRKVIPPEHFPVNEIIRNKEVIRNRIIGIERNGEGGLVWALVNAFPELNDENEINQVVVTFVDITDRKQAEEEIKKINIQLENRVKQRTRELEKAVEEANTANKAKSEFLSRMSHELRTPMNAILGFAQLLEMDAELNDDQRSNIREIHGAGRHLLELINEILDLSRIESGSISLSIAKISLKSVLKDCFSLVERLAAEKSINLTSSVRSCEKLSVMADYFRLKQVLLNLIANAIKYNKPNGSVTVECQTSGNSRILIKVIDTGQGISADKLPDIFNIFERLGAEKTNIEGTGIGLSITKSLVDLMGGEIGVTSEPGKGSVFWIELPYSQQ